MMPTYRVLFQNQSKRVLRVFAPSAGDAEKHVERLIAATVPVAVRREPENVKAKALRLHIIDICRESDDLDGGCGGRFAGGGDC